MKVYESEKSVPHSNTSNNHSLSTNEKHPYSGFRIHDSHNPFHVPIIRRSRTSTCSFDRTQTRRPAAQPAGGRATIKAKKCSEVHGLPGTDGWTSRARERGGPAAPSPRSLQWPSPSASPPSPHTGLAWPEAAAAASDHRPKSASDHRPKSPLAAQWRSQGQGRKPTGGGRRRGGPSSVLPGSSLE